MSAYVAAGLDPQRFWDLTPRLYATEMQGARERMHHARSLAWAAAMLPHLKDAPDHDTFVYGRQKQAAMRACLAAWDKVDRALARNRKRGPE